MTFVCYVGEAAITIAIVAVVIETVGVAGCHAIASPSILALLHVRAK